LLAAAKDRFTKLAQSCQDQDGRNEEI
jgi:hypothetical protein